jgi:indolepyruvate ferredoxin oxidoreductase
VAYQGKRLAKRYRALVDEVTDPALREAVAKAYHKVLAYKDEYEVARMLTETRAKASEVFEGDLKLTYHLAPPLLALPGKDGRPKKMGFGEWIERLYPVLAAFRVLRGTPFDPFGYTAERKMERGLIRDYEADVRMLIAKGGANPEAALALAELPLQIRGFGPVKQANAEAAYKRREELHAALRSDGGGVRQAAE